MSTLAQAKDHLKKNGTMRVDLMALLLTVNYKSYFSLYDQSLGNLKHSRVEIKMNALLMMISYL